MHYPDHVEYIRVLKESGFFNTAKIEVGEVQVSPFDFTSKVLFNEWKLGEMEEELTVMKVTVKGENEEISYNLYDEYCAKN